MDAIAGPITLLLALAIAGFVATRNRPIAAPLMVAFCLRALAAIVDVYLYQLPGNSDGPNWDRGATYYARNGVAGTLEYVGTGHELYKWMMSVLYALFGRSALMVQSINVLLGTLVIVNTWRLAKQLGADERSCRTAAWTVALFPSMIFFSALQSRPCCTKFSS